MGSRSADPTQRFTGLAAGYAQFRPTYPEPAVEYVMTKCGLARDRILVDVGCGTGISSRIFAGRGLRVIGIEPNAEMRAQAEVQRMPPEVAPPTYRDGRAENTGLDAGSADAVLAAQSFHWFDPTLALDEFHRILRPKGWVILLWNTRDPKDAFTATYSELVWSCTDRATTKGIREGSKDALHRSQLFQALPPTSFPNNQVLDEAGLLGRAFSASYAPKGGPRAEAYAAALHALFRQHARLGSVVLRYQTEVYLAQRR